MEEHTLNPTPAPKAPDHLKDGLDLWDSEAGGTAAALTAVRIDLNESLLVPFTTSMLRVRLHFLDTQAYRGFVHCSGDRCLLCRIGRKSEVRDLLPVYDAVARAVGVLAISESLRPNALRPQLAPILRQLKQGGRLVVTVRKLDNVRFEVGTLDLPEDADDGADKIRTFLRQLEAGVIDLGAVYPRLSGDELAGIPEIAQAMRLKGITLS
jgi:hypothetical protein